MGLKRTNFNVKYRILTEAIDNATIDDVTMAVTARSESYTRHLD